MDTRLLTFRSLIKLFTQGDVKTTVISYNDLFCLFLSQIAYFSDAFIIRHLEEIGSADITIIDYEGPTAICVNLDGITYVSVKGLSGRKKKEWPIVLNFLPDEFEGISVHSGFAKATNQLLPHIKKFISKYDNPVILTGHSMGGAIATLASLSVSGCKVVTFGSPRAVAHESISAFSDIEMIHYMIDTDFVTHLPWWMYARPGNHVVKVRNLQWLRFWDSHKLYTYSAFMMPMIVGNN